jgi:hypothetical protein
MPAYRFHFPVIAIIFALSCVHERALAQAAAPRILPMDQTDSEGKRREMIYVPRRASVSLRAAPDASSASVKQLAAGEELTIEGYAQPITAVSYEERDTLWYAARDQMGARGFVRGEDILDARMYRMAVNLSGYGARLSAALESDTASRNPMSRFSGIYSLSLGCIAAPPATRASSAQSATNMLSARAKTIVWTDNDLIYVALGVEKLAAPFAYRATFLREQRIGAVKSQLYRLDRVGSNPRTQYMAFTERDVTAYANERATTVSFRETRCGSLKDHAPPLAGYLTKLVEIAPASLTPDLTAAR